MQINKKVYISKWAQPVLGFFMETVRIIPNAMRPCDGSDITTVTIQRTKDAEIEIHA